MRTARLIESLPVAGRGSLSNNRAVPVVNQFRVSAFAVAMAIALAVPAATAPAGDDPPVILVSRQLAERERLHDGDIVTLATDVAGFRAKRFRIGGIYEPTPDPMRFTA